MVGGWKKAPQLWLAGSHYITCTLWLQNVFLTSPDKWPGQIWWANTPLIISGPAISGESGSLAQKVMCCHGILLTLNIRVIIAREVWYNQKQVRLSPELHSWYCELFFCVNWGKSNSQTVNFHLSFYIVLIFIHALCNVRHITCHISDKNCKTAKIFIDSLYHSSSLSS